MPINLVDAQLEIDSCEVQFSREPKRLQLTSMLQKARVEHREGKLLNSGHELLLNQIRSVSKPDEDDQGDDSLHAALSARLCKIQLEYWG